MKNEGCPCNNCKKRGLNCKGCTEGNAWRNKTIAEYKSKLPEHEFTSYVYDFRNKYLHYQQRKRK